jgi:hypothetical protein
MKETFYSNGKLITGEYLVLDGAKALMLTKFGQNLTVEKNLITWNSLEKFWFWHKSGLKTILFSEIINPELQEPETIKSTLLSILHEAYVLNPSFIKAEEGYIITPNWASKKWGLGTSSTLINNIAQWLQIDAFTLLNNSFEVVSYDIACAQTTHSLPSWKGKSYGRSYFKPDFTAYLFHLSK